MPATLCDSDDWPPHFNAIALVCGVCVLACVWESVSVCVSVCVWVSVWASEWVSEWVSECVTVYKQLINNQYIFFSQSVFLDRCEYNRVGGITDT